MGIRTVRLDADTEKILQQIVQVTGLSISEALKKGLLLLHHEMDQHTDRTPSDIYRQLHLGPGGYAIAPSTHTRQAVQQSIRKKLSR